MPTRLSARILEAVHTEYAQLELVSPAPGQPEYAHETMIAQGLCKAGADPANVQYNRYCNVVPFDSYRVKLVGDLYINATKFDRFPDIGERDFVVGIGPTSESIGRLWQAIWESRINVIVMLANPPYQVEPYFPTEIGKSCTFSIVAGNPVKQSSVTVRLVDEKRLRQQSCIIRRELELSVGDVSFMVTHMHYSGWPNYGVPDTVHEIADFVLAVNDVIEANPGVVTTYIHCAGGVGRSGTFTSTLIKYMQAYRSWRAGGEVNPSMVDIVTQLRKQRHPWMIEGVEQYIFTYELFLHLAEVEQANGAQIL